MTYCCGDNRFEIIAKAKKHLLESTNIECREDEMEVLDNILFRCWQMGWLNKYDDSKKEVDEDKLDELAKQYLEDTYPSTINITPIESEIENCINDFKAGYRKAMEG